MTRHEGLGSCAIRRGFSWVCADHSSLPFQHDGCGAEGSRCICNPTGAVQWATVLAEVPKDEGPLNQDGPITPYFSDSAPPRDLHEEALQKRIVDAVLELFDYTGTSAFSLPIPGTSPPLYVAAGEAETIALLVKQGSGGRRRMRLGVQRDSSTA